MAHGHFSDARSRRIAQVMGGIWLLFLVYPLIDVFTLPFSPLLRAVGVGGLVLFAWLYLRSFVARWPLSAAYAAAQLGIGLVFTHLFSGSFAACYVFAAAAFVWSATWRIGLAGILVALGCLAVSVLAGDVKWMDTWQFAMLILVQLVFNSFFRRARQAEHKLEEDRQRLARAGERDRIARDLHDVLGHTLSLVVLQSQLAARLVGQSPAEAEAKCRELEQTARSALAQLRTVVAGFKAQPLAESLSEAQRLCQAAAIDFAHTPPPELPHALGGIVGLLVREAVTNVVRHSGAGRCRIAIDCEAASAVVTIDDDGAGFDPHRAQTGSGLRGMRERLTAVGGRLEIGRRPEGGTRVRAWLPLARSNDAAAEVST